MRKKFLPAVLLISISSLFSLFLFEILLRLFFPQPLYSFEQHLFAHSRDYGYFLTPNAEKVHSQPDYTYTIKSNSFGFRGKEPDFNADYRVLILGDSLGMGQGVREKRNLCELSQQYFRKNNMNIDVFNTSLSGYSGINEVRVLKKFIKSYNPNLVILLFCWNDVGATESLSVQNGFLVIRAGNKFTAPLREWLNNHSHVYCLIKKFYYFQFRNTLNMSRPGHYSYADLEIAFKRIVDMQHTCDENKTVFFVVLLPLNEIYEEPKEFGHSKNLLISKLRDDSIMYDDWTNKLPQEHRNKLVFPHDEHWNEFGHEYFSQYLSRLIIGLKERAYNEIKS